MTPADRLRISAMIGQIIDDDSDVLNVELASELINLLPASPKSAARLELEDMGMTRRNRKQDGGSASGLTHFFGNVSVGFTDRQAEADNRKRDEEAGVVGAGNYKVMHSGPDGSIMIRDLWANTSALQQGKKFNLLYLTATKEPFQLDACMDNPVRLPFMRASINVPVFRTWKTNPKYRLPQEGEKEFDEYQKQKTTWRLVVAARVLFAAGLVATATSYALSVKDDFTCACKTDRVCAQQDIPACGAEEGAALDKGKRAHNRGMYAGLGMMFAAISIATAAALRLPPGAENRKGGGSDAPKP